ncbi:MAG: hypothetical protein C4583_09215 [Anaerolineaceae bacterium]|nr:MAG: hypothetical protein C4583_09215 [Anaerolineaceae bacterium]
MSDLQKFYPIVAKVAEVVDYMMVEEMGLMPPEQYDVNERDDRVYITASFNPLALGRSLKAYEHPDVARRLQSAMGGLPVTITRKTGTHYVILLTGKISLPRTVEFPGFGERDVFRLGVGLRGEVSVPASRLQNVIIGAGQGAGKSNIQALLVHQARAFGWKLYLADPDGHTFNPDVWNSMASAPVASSPADLLLVLDRIAGELADRVALFRQAANGGIPPADIDAYNEVASNPLPRIAFAVDEANSYLGDKRVFAQMADLLRRGRKWGLHIFLSGHEWHKETVQAEVNDMLQTRIGLTVASEQTSAVVLRSLMWGKRVMGKPAGRGVMRTNRYEPMQFYLVTEKMEREWLGQTVVTPEPLPEKEAALVMRAIQDAEGRMSIPLLREWGLEEREARSLVEMYELRGWLEKDPQQKNARFVTAKLALLVSNCQTGQTVSSTQMWSQTGVKLSQPLNLASRGIQA